MLPRVLLFTSDERTAQLLTRVLAELELEAEHCPEIFAAVEKLTSRSFHAIIADWKQEVEASFLLKTARDLKATKSTFALAIVDQKSVSAAFAVGVNGVLMRPLTVEQSCNTLAAARELILGEKSADPGLSGRTITATAASRRIIEAASQVIDGDESQERAFAAASKAVRQAHRIKTSRPVPAPRISPLPTRKGSGKTLGLAASVAFVAVLLTGAWKFGLLHNRMSDRQVLDTVTGIAPDNASPNRATQTSAPAVTSLISHSSALSEAASVDSPFAVLSSSAVRVRPILASSQKEAKSAESIQVPVDPPAAEPNQVISETSSLNPEIPESLLSPVPAMTAHPPSTKSATTGIKWSGDPIMLPEEASRPLVMHQVLPGYPEEALRAGLQGAVVLRAWVARDGSIRELKLVQGSLVLGQAAFQAVKQWRYKPYRLNGEIVEMQTLITIDFKRQ